MTRYWFEVNGEDDSFGTGGDRYSLDPACPASRNPGGYVPCGSVYNEDQNEQSAFWECMERSVPHGSEHDAPPRPAPVPALPAAAAAALAALLCCLGVGRSRCRRGCRLD